MIRPKLASLLAWLLTSQLTAATLDVADIYPQPLVPADNPWSQAKATLGQQLFHDTRLSVTGTVSCATCHQPERHFTDGLTRAIGATGETHEFNTPTLYNAALNSSLGWTDQGLTILAQQHLVPLLNTNPVEMGFHPDLVPILRQDPDYAAAFRTVFGTTQVGITQIAQAIASYVRTLQPPVSRFDHYLFRDDQSALSKEEKQGMALFFSDRLGCATCHANLTFSGPIRHAAEQAEPVFHVTSVSGETRAFRAPTLRQISQTAPYMHDGSLPDLLAVIEHYESVDVERVPDFRLTAAEREALVAFLQSL